MQAAASPAGSGIRRVFTGTLVRRHNGTPGGAFAGAIVDMQQPDAPGGAVL